MVPEHQWFYFKHGRRASGIEELRAALEEIGEAEFKHHVSNEKNDFASWVEHVFGEAQLAKSLREVSDKEGIIIILDNFLKTQKHGHHKHHDKLQEETIGEPFIPAESKPVQKQDKVLSEKEIKNLVDEAMEVFKAPEEQKHEAREVPDAEKAIEEPGQELSEETGEEITKPDEQETGLHNDESWNIIPEPPEVEKPVHHKENKERVAKGPSKFMVEEFLYGFILGLIVGLIMLGILLNI